MAAQKKKAVAKRKRKPPAKPRGRPTKLTPQNIDRLVTVFRAAKRVSRVLLIDLYTAVVLEATGRDSVPQSDWADVSLYIPHRQRVFIKERGLFDDLRLATSQKPYFSLLRLKAASPPSMICLIAFRTISTSIAPSPSRRPP